MGPWYLYVLECVGGRLYTGISPDVERRFGRHVAGKGGAFTRANRPVRILGCVKLPDRAAATRAEAALKGLCREEKLRWAGDHPWGDEPAAD